MLARIQTPSTEFSLSMTNVIAWADWGLQLLYFDESLSREMDDKCSVLESRSATAASSPTSYP